MFHKLAGTIQTAEAEFKEGPPEVHPISTDDQFRGLLEEAFPIPPLADRVDTLFPKKQKRYGHSLSPRPPLRHGTRTQTPAQKRRSGKSRSGKSTALAENAKTQLTITSPRKDAYPSSMDSEDFGSDIVITEIYQKPKNDDR
jgi:hypothetical protein